MSSSLADVNYQALLNTTLYSFLLVGISLGGDEAVDYQPHPQNYKLVYHFSLNFVLNYNYKVYRFIIFVKDTFNNRYMVQ